MAVVGLYLVLPMRAVLTCENDQIAEIIEIIETLDDDAAAEMKMHVVRAVALHSERADGAAHHVLLRCSGRSFVVGVVPSHVVDVVRGLLTPLRGVCASALVGKGEPLLSPVRLDGDVFFDVTTAHVTGSPTLDALHAECDEAATPKRVGGVTQRPPAAHKIFVGSFGSSMPDVV